MKNKIYYFGIICCLLILTGCLFKIFHWTGAGIIISLSFPLFALVFMPVALINSYRSENAQKLKGLYIIAFICLLIEITGALFKIQHWPGAGLLMIFCIPLPFILFLPAYLIHVNRNKQLNYNNILLVLFFFGYFGAISALLSLNVSKNIIDESIVASYNNEQNIKQTNDQTLAIIDALSASNVSNSVKQSLWNIKENTDNIYKLIDILKVDIIKKIDIENRHIIKEDGTIDLWKMNGKDYDLSGSLDVLDNEIAVLKNSIKKYRNFLLSGITEDKSEAAAFIEYSLDTKDQEGQTWEERVIFRRKAVFLIQTLNQIKKDVALATYEAVSTIEDSNYLN